MTSLKRKKAVRRLIAVSMTLVIPVLGLLVALAAIIAEHHQRAGIVRHGVPILARIEASEQLRKSCQFRYAFEAHGRRYEGGEGGCPLVSRFAPGDPIRVRFDPGDPSRSVAPGADRWPRWTFVTVVGLGFLLFFEGMTILEVWRTRSRSRRRHRPSIPTDRR